MDTTKSIKGIRHGDVGLFLTDTLPKGLKASKTGVLLLSGSSGNPHSFTGGTFYPAAEKHDFIIGYLKAKKTKLFHAEHSPQGAEIEDGIYEIRKQAEHTPDGLRQIID